MQQFIVGYPANKKPVFDNIAQYGNMMDASAACSDFVGAYTESLDKAKEKLTELATRNFRALKHYKQSHPDTIGTL